MISFLSLHFDLAAALLSLGRFITHNGPRHAEVAALPDGHGHRTMSLICVPGSDGAVGHSRSERRHPAKMAT